MQCGAVTHGQHQDKGQSAAKLVPYLEAIWPEKTLNPCSHRRPQQPAGLVPALEHVHRVVLLGQDGDEEEEEDRGAHDGVDDAVHQPQEEACG